LRTRGLSDLRTATTSRIHAKPPQKGTEHLNLYLLDKESQRLEQELAALEHRQKRIHVHQADIRKAMAKAEEEARREHQPGFQTEAMDNLPSGERRLPQWKKMSVGY
jgi:hypothetical protein